MGSTQGTPGHPSPPTLSQQPSSRRGREREGGGRQGAISKIKQATSTHRTRQSSPLGGAPHIALLSNSSRRGPGHRGWRRRPTGGTQNAVLKCLLSERVKSKGPDKRHASIQQENPGGGPSSAPGPWASGEPTLHEAGLGAASPLRPPAVCLARVHTQTHAGTHTTVSAHVHAWSAGGSPLLHVVLCPAAPAASPIPTAPAVPPATAQHLREVIHDRSLFGVKQVELPGEEDEVDVESVQVSV